jgi:transcriptional regulator with XRE-family HTH domain
VGYIIPLKLNYYMMKERLIEFLKAENKTSAQLAEEIGVQPSGISHILSGRNKPSLDFVLKMLEKYTFLSTEWLLFGRGNMYKDESMQKLFEDIKESEKSTDNVVNQPFEESEKKISDVNLRNTGDHVRDEKQKVEKIVWFYTDKSFHEYLPGKD